MNAPEWTSLSDEQLLERRISTLGLRLEGTNPESLIRQLYDELRRYEWVWIPGSWGEHHHWRHGHYERRGEFHREHANEHHHHHDHDH